MQEEPQITLTTIVSIHDLAANWEGDTSFRLQTVANTTCSTIILVFTFTTWSRTGETHLRL